MTDEPTQRARRFELIDALRGIAALAVVMPHAVGLFIYPGVSGLPPLSRVALRLADIGRSSVEVFFVISGFAIAYSLRGAVANGFSLARFLLRRAVRLDPPYWVGILLMGAVNALRARTTHQPIELPALGKVIAHLFYLQDILGLGNFNVVFWTLCLEFQLYLVFAIIVRVLSLRQRPPDVPAAEWTTRQGQLLGSIMVGAFLCFLVVSHTFWPMRPGWFVPFFYLFLSGALAAWLTLGLISERIFLICLGAMVVALCFRFEQARLFGVLTVILIYAAIRRQALHRWLSGSVAQWLGKVSYAVYLVHAPIAGVFLGVRTRIDVGSAAVSVACLCGTYAVALAAACGLHRLVEVPCLRLSHRLRVASPPASASRSVSASGAA